MAPTGWETSKQNINLAAQVWGWNNLSRLGEVFDSSCGFILPNGAIKSPNVAWISTAKLAKISGDMAFPNIVPDFVIELCSKSNKLQPLQEKMVEYRDNGVTLGLLLNRQDGQVEIYRLGKDVEILQTPATIDCAEILPGFSLNLAQLW